LHAWEALPIRLALEKPLQSPAGIASEAFAKRSIKGEIGGRCLINFRTFNVKDNGAEGV
jgi:hypothetical protein